MASSEERIDEPAKEMVHKTKVIQFLGRTTPIILQNDNGPCPLLAICNVLLLKNSLNLSPDVAEVSQEKLLSLVAERLIDSNSNVNNKDAGYVENQQQNIADAIDLLPRLATGIDVNIKFRRIDDFEFTCECTIFDLLDIPLYHGWIVDPQDSDTANAIGSKSYNTLMGELVALEIRNTELEYKKTSEEDSVDFAAATAATLGVPSPSLSRGRSFDDSPHSVSDHHLIRKGDMAEEAELLRVLKLSEGDLLAPLDVKPVLSHDGENLAIGFSESSCLKKSEPVVLTEKVEGYIETENHESHQHEHLPAGDHNALSNFSDKVISQETANKETACSKTGQEKKVVESTSEKTGVCEISKDTVEESRINDLSQEENMISESSRQDAVSAGDVPSFSNRQDPASADEYHIRESNEDGHSQNEFISKTGDNGIADGRSATELCRSSEAHADSDSSNNRRQHTEVPNAFTSSVDDGEPIYEGEDCILDSAMTVHQDREPIYEGEVVLTKQVEKSTGDACNGSSKDEINPKQGELIRNFLNSTASQLTIYGLFCLQDGLKERELCVFFRNNHFNTMFKFDGELYILATDQGYINQPDLVWEKLNEVNGNTVFMTGNFKEFKIEDHSNSTWDEQDAVTSTADYLASIDKSAPADSSFNSDLQLAIALQQQEFEHQPQRNMQQPTVTSSSRLITGPQVPRSSARSSHVSSKPEPKPSKDKCTIM